MSDFDREAEREKLREQFERDKQKREASERMSELLLQGATMTNRHCPECHSPVFRYDGKEFCPTCQREVTEDGEFADDAGANGEGTATAESADAQAATNGEAEVDDTASAEGEVDAGVEQPETPDTPETPETEPAADQPAETRQPAETQTAEETRPAPARDRRPARVDPPARRERPTAESEAGDLGEAEAALVREITNLTRRAEETRDVGRKRDLFAAAREATETLRELRRV
ncbi:Sjogren's syndrome/scleroderma autoantigen 1 family protein [Natronomonas gomsonensis]|uniref:Sjogren's syndrome/scleroderma autoantigen 1 family protein n=1 Tax=Natronomonas gomsonensis TaxID=1046043 RepID=UPI0015BBD559|nr:Sjogren's syndrome/scleroderma autoantigen 1 family protein [Natronomonas gomsonensis]